MIWLNISQLVFQIITTLFVIYLAIAAVRFGAKPRLGITFRGGRKTAECVAGERTTLGFHIWNKGHWLAKPMAQGVMINVNFSPEFSPTEIRYGSQLEKNSRNVMIGKVGRKYLNAEGIQLPYDEPGEDFEVDLEVPDVEGRFPIEIPARSQDGGYGFARLWLSVVTP